MYLPQSYLLALLFMISSMLCWGSWANAMKLSPGYRFQLFYWDYILGLFAGCLLLGFTLGSGGPAGPSFLASLHSADSHAIRLAIAGGAVFNVANLLFVAAIEIAGMAVAFPIAIGLALVIGTVSGYLFSPQGNPVLIFGGVALVVVAIVCDALAYRAREAGNQKSNRLGIILSLVAGVLMGTFYPLVSRSMSGAHPLGPYAVALPFALGVALCAVPLNYFLMRKPIDGNAPLAIGQYWKAPASWHGAGILGGVIWMTGAVLNFVASQVHFVGPAISYSIGQGATMVSAVWGVFIWHEFQSPTDKVRLLLLLMFICFLAGLTSIAIAPLYASSH